MGLIRQLKSKLLSDSITNKKEFNFQGINFNNTKLNMNLSTSKEYLSSYYNQLYIGYAVDFITNTISSMEWEIEYPEQGASVYENNVVPEIKELYLDNPENAYDIDEIIKKTLQGICLDCACWNFVDLDKRNRQLIDIYPSALIRLVDELNNEITAKTLSIDKYPKYVYLKKDSTTFKLNWNDLSMIGFSSPYNTLRPMGLIESSNMNMNQAQVLNVLLNQFLENGSYSNFILTPKTSVAPSAQSASEWSRFLANSWSGVRNAWKPLINATGGEIQEIKRNSFKDAMFLEQQESFKKFVASMFGIPALYMDSDSKYNSQYEQKKILYETSLPRYTRVLEKAFNKYFRRLSKLSYGDPRFANLNFKFVYPSIIDQKERSEIGERGIKFGAITPNEYRKFLGFEEIEKKENMNPVGDKFLLQMNMIEAGMEETSPTPTPTPNTETEKSNNKEKLKTKENVDKNPVRLSRKESKIRSEWLKIRDNKRYKKKFNEAVQRFMYELESYTKQRLPELYSKHLDKLKTKEIDSNIDSFEFSTEVMDGFEYNQKADEAMKPPYVSALVLGADRIKSLFNFTDSEFDSANPFKSGWFNRELNFLIERFSKETYETRRRGIDELVKNAIENNLTLAQLNDTTDKYFDTFKDGEFRAERIAQTELGRAYEAGNKEIYREMGIQQLYVKGCQSGPTSTGMGRDCSPQKSKLYPIDHVFDFKINHGYGTIYPANLEQMRV